MGDKYDDSIASCFYAPAFLRMILSHRPPPNVISHHNNISPRLERDAKLLYHLFRTENAGGGVYSNLTINDEPPKVSRCHNHFLCSLTEIFKTNNRFALILCNPCRIRRNLFCIPI